MHLEKDEKRKETEALLKYMLHHNEHHAEELEQLADDLQRLGLDAAGRALREAVSDFQKGNRGLSLVLTMIQDETDFVFGSPAAESTKSSSENN